MSRRRPDVVLAARIAFWLTVVTAGLRVKTLPELVASLARGRKRHPLDAGSERERARKISGYGDRLMRWRVFGGKAICWKRALVLYRMLPQDGARVRIVFGVKKGTSETLEGHAWVELDGTPLDGTEPGAFSVSFSHS